MGEYYPNLNPVSDVLNTIKKTFVKLAPELNQRTKMNTNSSLVADILATLEDTDGKYNELYYTNLPRIYECLIDLNSRQYRNYCPLLNKEQTTPTANIAGVASTVLLLDELRLFIFSWSKLAVSKLIIFIVCVIFSW